jgi:DNA-binding NtrC family response regulator
VTVDSVAEARAAIVEHRPAVVISDAWLGDESTEAFVTELLAGSQLDTPSVVVLSADANPSTIARFRRLGVASYLSKPIHLDRLATVVTDLANSLCADEGNGTRARTNAASGS